MSRDAVKKLQSPIGLVKELVNIPFSIFTNLNAIGVYKAQISFSLVSLALKLNKTPKKDLMGTWLESHEEIKSIAHRRALLTIHDSVAPSMKGTKEFALFQKFIITNTC